jgi:hypothetical protein
MNNINLNYLRQIVPKFREFLKSGDQKWIKEREEKDKIFKPYFSKEGLKILDEAALKEMINTLWAFYGWTNKDYLFQEMLKSGIEKVRKSFEYLLYNDDPISKRFDHVRKNVRMMGAAGISEILTHHDHDKYPIYNSRAKEALIAIGIPESSLPKSSQISGNQYEDFCTLMIEVRITISAEFPEFKDFFSLDFLLFYVSLHKPKMVSDKTSTKIDVQDIDDFDHDNVIDQVLELGDGLGFEVEKEFLVTHGCKIDAIWRSRIGNLGIIKYAFEIHRKGSRDSAILNLQRVKRDASIQKVIIVSTKDELDVFRREISTLGEDFRNSVGYFSVDDLQTTLDHMNSMKGMLKTLGLMDMETIKTN